MFDLSPKAKRLLKKLPRYFVMLVAVLLVIYLFVLTPYLNSRDKQRFAAMEARIETTAFEISSSFNLIPINSAWEKSCGYASRSFGDGPLRCQLALIKSYGVVTVTEANEAMIKVARTLALNLSDRSLHGGTSQESFINSHQKEQIFSASINDSRCEGCSVSLRYRVNSPDDDTGDLKIIVSFIDESRIEYYPLNN